MTLKMKSSLLCIVTLSLSGLMFAQEMARAHSESIALRDGWSMQSSGKVDEKGDTLSTPPSTPKTGMKSAFPPRWWRRWSSTRSIQIRFSARISGHFLASAYPIGANFSNIPMQPDSPFIIPWWYRKEFVVPASSRGRASG